MPLNTADHICAWGRMRKYYRELCEWSKTMEAARLDRRHETKIHNEKERVMAWILKAEAKIEIEFIEIPSRNEWGGQTGY